MKFTIVLICALICGCAAYHSFEELDSKRSKPDQIQKDIFKFIADTVKKVKNDTAPVLEIVKQRIALFKSSIDNSKASILSLSNQLGRQTTWRLIQTINRADEQVTKKVSPRYIGQQLKKLHDEIEKMYGKQLEDKIKDFRKAIKAKPNAQICWDDNKEQLFNYASDTINNFETYLYKEFVNLDKIVEDVRKEIEMFLTQSTADIKTCNETPDTANKCIQDYFRAQDLPTKIGTWSKTINDAIDVGIVQVRQHIFDTLAEASQIISLNMTEIESCILFIK